MLNTIWLMSSILLIVFIMIQNPKSQSIMGSTQMFPNTRTTEQNVTRITWILTTVFLLATILRAIETPIQ
jgi:protein translocase SecG subunit